jgi:PAS domain S-box-containing protein
VSAILRSTSLKTRILVIVLAILIAGIWGVAARTAAVLQADIAKLVAAQMSATVKYVADDIDRKIQSRIDTLNELVRAISPDIASNPARLREQLQRHHTSIAEFPTGVYVVNGAGTIVAEQRFIEGRLGGSLKDRAFFITAMATGKTTVGSPVVGRFKKEPVMTVAVPVLDAAGKAVAVLAGSLHPSDPNLFGELEDAKIGSTGYFVVASPKDHLIISATDKSRILQALPAPGVNPLLDRRLSEGFEGAGIARSSLGVDVMTVSRNMKSTGWVIVAAIPTAEAFAPIATLQRQIYAAALLMSVAIALVLYFVLSRLLAPIEATGARIQRMTHGEEPLVPLPVLRNDEIGRLVDNFNRLLAERLRLESSLRSEIAERQRAENSLKANEELMRGGFQQAAVAIAHIDTGTCRILMANDKFCQLLGYAQHEAVGTDIRTLMPAEELPACESDRTQLLAGTIRLSGRELRLIKKRGELLWVHCGLSLMRDERGLPGNFIAVFEDISARKEADEARARLAAVAEGSNDAIFIRDVEGRIVYWNDGATHYYGYTADEISGKSSAFLVPSELLEERQRNWEKLLKGEPVANFETVRLHKNGTRLDVSISVSPVKDQAGKLIGMATIARDITERKQAEKTRAYLAAIVDGSHDAIVSRSLDRNILSWNAAAERLFGYSAEEATGRNISMLIPDDRMEESRRNRDLLASGTAVSGYETVRLAKNGRRVDVSMTQSPIYDEHGVMVGVALIFRDISEHKGKAALMQLLESLARATNEATTPEVAMQACLERICTYGDWPLGHVAMYAPGETSGVAPISYWRCADTARYADFISFSDRFSHNVPKGQFVGVAMRERRPVWIEDLMSAPDFGRISLGTKYGIRTGFVFPVIVGDEVAGFLEFFATEVRARDEQLLEAINSVASQLARLIERSRSAAHLARVNAELEMRVANRTAELETANQQMASFSYTVAHDLRTPLRAINGFSALVLETNADKLTEASVGHLKRIHAGSVRMGELIDDLLELTRLSRQEIRRHHISLSDLTAKVVAALTDAFPERRVAVTIQPGMHVYADAGLLRIVLENLIGNAWKFTARADAAKIDIGSELRDGKMTFFVRDNGAGFNMEYAHKLFTPFQRLHHAGDFEGTGIGLATVKNIIQRHGGDIRLESAVNRGTTAFFTIGNAT